MISFSTLSRRLFKSLGAHKAPHFTYYTTKKYSDIIPLESSQSGFVLNLPQLSLPINPDVSVIEIQSSVSANRRDIKTVEFFNEDQVVFSKTSPISLIIRDNFYIKINNDFFYVITHTNPLIQRKTSYELDQHSLYVLSNNLGHSDLQREVLVKYVKQLLENIQVGAKPKIDCNFIRLVNRKILSRFALESSFKTADIDDKLAFLDAKISHLEKSREDCEALLQKRSTKRLRIITAVMLSQIALLQYWTYYALSWDIVEPMACLLGIGELIVGYIFWMRSDKEYNLKNINDRFMERRRGRVYRKLLFDNQEILKLQNMREYLSMKKIFSSCNSDEILKLLISNEEKSGETQETD